MIGQPVRGAQSSRRIRQNGYGRDNSRERHQKRRGVVARHGQSRLWRRTPDAARRDERHAQRDRRGGDGLGEDLVAGGRVRQDPRELVARRSVRERSHDVLETHPVGLGENEIEDDRRGAEFGQLVRQFGETRSRPRPLSEDSQTFIVDADHANRRVPVVSPRRRPLEGIENEIAQIVEKQRLSEPPGENQKRGQQRGKQINVSSSPHPLLRSRRRRPALIRRRRRACFARCRDRPRPPERPGRSSPPVGEAWNVFSFAAARAGGCEGENRRGSESGPPHAPPATRRSTRALSNASTLAARKRAFRRR